MKAVIVHAAAKAELNEAVAWYETRLKGLGLDLATEVETAIQRLRENPERCAPHKKTGFRKRFVRRFPYVIYFKEVQQVIWIVAVAHTRRRPDYWMDRQAGT